MEISFSLRTEKQHKKTGAFPIQITVNDSGIRVRRNLSKVSVLLGHWDERISRVIPSKRGETKNFASEINLQIEEVSTRLNKLKSNCLLLNLDPSKDEILNAIENKVKSTIANPNPKLVESFDSFIEQNRSHRAERTITGYTTTRNLFIDFFNHSSIAQELNKLDLKFFDEFRNYCFQERKFMNNTFAKVTNNLKAFMNWAEDRNLHTNSFYKKFKSKEENIEVIYLTMDELMQLYKFEFKNERLSRARDIYCFSCFTGLRYSDLNNLKASNIYDNFIKLTIYKTQDKDQVIPLSKFSKELLQKYEDTIDNPIPKISSQKLNEYIKEACEKAGLKSQVTITRYSGNRKIEKTVPKYELITLHTGRKTFVTNSLVLGMNHMVVRGITGHKSDSAFRKYVKVADEVKSEELIKFWDIVEND